MSIRKVSIQQVKAARALLGWSQSTLAAHSTVSEPTIKRLEAAKGNEIGGRPGTAEAIVAALEKAGIIRGYRADIADPSMSAVACLLVKLKHTPSPQVVKRLERLPEVKRCLSLAGEIDLLIDIAAESLGRLNQIRDEISHFPEVAETTTAVVLRQEI